MTTDLDFVKATFGVGMYQDLVDKNFSILLADKANSWRGFRHGRYLKGTNAYMPRFPSHEDAVRHVATFLMIEYADLDEVHD